MSFNGTAAAPTVTDDEHLSVVVPDGATNGPVSVTTTHGVVAGPSFTVDPVSIDRPAFLH